MSLYGYDRLLLDQGYREICGVDEAGRGPLAGPVYAAAVMLPLDGEIEGLNDSKKLTEKRREALYGEIVKRARAFCVASASVEEIESLNILGASLLAMRRAVEGLSLFPDCVLIDGNRAPKLEKTTAITVVKGDGISASIAAASILAKVSRDRHLLELDTRHPQYRFGAHKGYPTKLHYEMLDRYGPCPVHRPSFLRKWREKQTV